MTSQLLPNDADAPDEPDVFVLPASYAQQRLWVIDQLEPGRAAYNVSTNLRLHGPLDAVALAAALGWLAERHETLRTVFDTADGQPVQVILPPAPVPLPVADLSSLGSAEEREAELARAARAESTRPFDLREGPVWRAALVRLAADDHALLLTLHHITVDGWSLGVLQRELSAAYAAFAAGAEPALPELPIQYADYAAWQREHLAGGALDEQLEYWKRQLAAPLPVLELPTDRPRTANRERVADAVSLELPAAATQALAALARDAGATPFVVLLAGFQLLLSRYCGQDDVVVGSPVAGRTRRETEGLIGLFLNTLAIRTSLAGAPSFRELVARVRDTVRDALARQDLPFERVVEAVQPERDRARNPVFQALFSFQDFALTGPLTLGPVAATRIGGGRGTAKFDLQLIMNERAGAYCGTLEYDASLLDADSARRLADNLVALLTAAAAQPDTTAARLPMLADVQRRQLLEEWAGEHVEYAGGDTLVALLDAQAARTPDAVAVEDERRTLTYAELDSAANALARRLRDAGVGAGVLVGVCAERSAELVVALVAAVKAGGAYVPLDPEYPRDRLAFMLEDANVGVLLATRATLALLPPAAAPVIALEGAAERRDAADARPLAAPAADDPAYMIYTSGSTGRPKGAVNAHRGIVNRLQWMQAEYRLTSADVVLQKTPFSFDVSVWEFFWPLMTGARVVMARPGGHRDPAYLADVVTRRAVTVCHFVPSMLRAFLADGAAARCTSLRDVMASGEALAPDLVAAFNAVLPSARLHNLYGPTECAVDVSYWPCPRATTPPAVVPIGRPVANTRLHVLDDAGGLVPVGVSGELHLAGVQVGLGYHGRPELTAEKFVADPFDSLGGRMYRTGDRARWLPDGTVEYLGRLDFQVKVRGFRIELGEIEAALLAHDAVADAVVVARDDAAGKRLVAYWSPRPGAATDTAALRVHLGASLPDYMVPSAFVRLDALPLSANGKVDRKALPAPDDVAVGERVRVRVAPRTTVEHQLVQLWRSLLGAEVGIRDDFFELGGHSLLAVQMLAEIERLTGRRVPLAALFDGATIERLATRVEGDVQGEAEPPVVLLQKDGAERPFAFVHGDVRGGGWYCRRLAPLLGADVPLVVLPTMRPEPGAPATVEEMAAAHVATLRAVQPAGPYRLGGYCAGGMIAFEMARQLQAAGERVDRLVLVDTVAANARFRRLEPLVGLLSRADTTEERLERRGRVLKALRYYSGRVRTVARQGAAERWRWISLNVRRRIPGLRPVEPTKVPIVDPGAEFRARAGTEVLRFQARAAAAYMPQPFAGDVELVVAADPTGAVSAELTAAQGTDAAAPELRAGRRGWERVARSVRVYPLRTSHIGLITEQLPALAETIRATLGDGGA